LEIRIKVENSWPGESEVQRDCPTWRVKETQRNPKLVLSCRREVIRRGAEATTRLPFGVHDLPAFRLRDLVWKRF